MKHNPEMKRLVRKGASENYIKLHLSALYLLLEDEFCDRLEMFLSEAQVRVVLRRTNNIGGRL